MEENERAPITDLKTLDDQDERDLLAGYWAGFRGDGHEPSAEFNRAYWHGWRNGMADSNRLPIDSAMRKLCSEWLDRERYRLTAKGVL